LALSAIWAFVARKYPNEARRRTLIFVFRVLLLGVVMIFLYLLFHEGGYALAQLAGTACAFADWVRGSAGAVTQGGPRLNMGR